METIRTTYSVNEILQLCKKHGRKDMHSVFLPLSFFTSTFEGVLKKAAFTTF